MGPRMCEPFLTLFLGSISTAFLDMTLAYIFPSKSIAFTSNKYAHCVEVISKIYISNPKSLDVVKQMYYLINNSDKIEVVVIMVMSAAIGIGILSLQTVTHAFAINGEELSYLREGNSSLIIMTNESDTHSSYSKEWPNIHSNVKTDFNTNVSLPEIQETAFIHPFAVIIGNCYIGKFVLVAPTAVCRGDEGTPIHVNDYSNMQDGVILHGLETTEKGKNID
jgi:hypothetical protein